VSAATELTPLAEALRSKGEPVKERAFRWVLRGALLVSLLVIVLVLGFLLIEGWSRLDLRLLTNMPTLRFPERAGAQSAIMGTLWIMGTTAAICIPTGVAAAVYLEEYADSTRWWNRLIEINLQNLASVPSIIFGILGLAFFARVLGLGFTVLTAGLTLSLLVLPTIIISAREALKAVPQSIRDGSLALGATRWQTTRKQVLPAAVPGIATGTILGLSRAAGEAAPLLLLGAVTFVTFNPTGLDSAYTAIPIQIYNWSSNPKDEFQVLAAALGVVMLLLVLLLNGAAIYIRNKYQKRW
jgi:phosphate transport system permease protein